MAFEGHRVYYAERGPWGTDNRFLPEILERKSWDDPDEFGVLDPRTHERSQHA